MPECQHSALGQALFRLIPMPRMATFGLAFRRGFVLDHRRESDDTPRFPSGIITRSLRAEDHFETIPPFPAAPKTGTRVSRGRVRNLRREAFQSYCNGYYWYPIAALVRYITGKIYTTVGTHGPDHRLVQPGHPAQLHPSGFELGKAWQCIQTVQPTGLMMMRRP